MLAQMFGGHLNLLASFLIPLAMYLALARLRGRIGRQAFTLGLLALVTAQFLITTEIVATMTVFGALALAAAWAMGERDLRRRIVELAAPIFLAYLGTAILVSPYLYYLFAGFRTTSIYSPSWHSADLLNFLVPTRDGRTGIGNRTPSPRRRRLHQQRCRTGRLRWIATAGARGMVHA